MNQIKVNIICEWNIFLFCLNYWNFFLIMQKYEDI